ncbi:AAA family ATPase [archaeon]|nr:AAA family ATPase [archaeon]
MNRLSTGIDGLDSMIGGGIPERTSVLLSGACGTGKTVFGLQFLCKQETEKGLFLGFNEDEVKLREICNGFGWDIKKMEESSRLRFLKYDMFGLQDFFEVLENNIREVGASRLVIDPVSSIGVHVQDSSEVRRSFVELDKVIKRNGCTAILTTEIEKPGVISRYGVEEFVFDGVIVLQNEADKNNYKRKIIVMKMRGSEHSTGIHDYNITKGGIAVV